MKQPGILMKNNIAQRLLADTAEQHTSYELYVIALRGTATCLAELGMLMKCQFS